MKTTMGFLICLIGLACNFSLAQETNKVPDAIDWLIAELGSSDGWGSGIVSSVNLPETALTEEVVSNAFKQQERLYKRQIEYKILESRKVEFPGTREKYTAALAQTSVGQKIVLFKYDGKIGEMEIGWWYRIYDASKSFTLDRRGDVIRNWLDFPYARGSERRLAFVEIESISNEQTTFRTASNSKVSNDNGKTWYNLLHVRAGMATCKIIECPDNVMPTNVAVYFERAGYVPTRETSWSDWLVQPKARLLGFFTQKDGKWTLEMSQFYDPVSELLDPYGKRLQAIFKTPLASEDALVKRKQAYAEARIRAQQQATNNVNANK